MTDAKLTATLSAVDRFTRVVRRANQSLRPLQIRATETQRAFRRLSHETGLGQLVRTLGRAAGPMQRFGAAARRAAGPLGVITGGGAIVGLASLTTSYARTGDEVAKFASTVGVSIERLQALRFAADRQGASSEALNLGLRTLSRAMGELRVGTGELNSFLERTSPSLRDALKNAKDTEGAFMLLSQAVSETEDPFLRSKLAAAAFGESGQNLLNLLAGGPASIAALSREFESLGGAIGTKAAKDAEAFQDRMANLRVAMGGLRNAIGGQLLPVLTPMIAALTGWITANRELISQKIGAFVTRVAEVVEKVDFETIQIAAGAFAAVLSGPLISGLASVIGTIGSLASVLAANPILLAVAGLGAAAITLIRNWDGVKGFFVDLWESISDATRQAWKAIQGFLDSNVFDRVNELAESVGGFVGGVADFLGLGDDRTPAFPNAGQAGAVQSPSGQVTVRIMGENLPQGTRLGARASGNVETDVRTDDLLGVIF